MCAVLLVKLRATEKKQMAVSINKIKTGSWQVSINHYDKQKRIVVGTKKAAIGLKDMIELELAQLKLGFLNPKRKRITFTNMSEEWMVVHKYKAFSYFAATNASNQ